MVSTAYQVPQVDMWVLLAQEHGRIGQISVNKNRTFDIGPFQINSRWLPDFTRLWRLSSQQETLEKLRDHGCWNAAAAGAIYRYEFDRAGDRRRALGLYHSATPALAAQYLAQLDKKYRLLFGDTVTPP
jgi:hypothetical protein